MPYRRPGPDSEPPMGWSPRDLLVPYLLLAVSMQRAHGYLIEDYLKGLGMFRVDTSTLYRTLRQMEKDGLLCSAWAPSPAGPARRLYTVTAAGTAWLEACGATLGAYRGMLDRFFAVYQGNQPPQSETDAAKQGT